MMLRRLLSLFQPSEVAQPAGLISVLADHSARLDERDDAAMDLSNYDEALPTLVAVMTRPGEDEMIVDSCAEAIWEIWERTHQFDQFIFDALPKLWQDAVTESKQNWDHAQN